LIRPHRLVALVGAVLISAACSPGGAPGAPQASASAPLASAGPSSDPYASSTPGSLAPGSLAPAGSGSTAAGSCPTSQPAALPAGQKRLVTIDTAKGQIQVTVEADLSPIAAGNFVALASCGFYIGVVLHRLVPGFVILGGDPTGTGTGGPGYTIKDEPVTTTYHRGTVAMARSAAPNSVGSQFFIVLSDDAASALADPAYNNYQIIGTVTTGMNTVDAIAAMPNSGPPNNDATTPVAMDKVTVATP
jgi:cyclophilin family peptidyl-prolyl cis-trans isomerase